MTNQTPTTEKLSKSIEKELQYIATYASVERREELFQFLRQQFLIATQEAEKAVLEELHTLSLKDKAWLMTSELKDYAASKGYSDL